MSNIEHYEDWKARMEREGVPDPPVIFAGNWARKAIEELEEERDALRQQLRGAVSERTRILEVAHKVLPAADYNALVKTLAGWPAPERGQ